MFADALFLVSLLDVYVRMERHKWHRCRQPEILDLLGCHGSSHTRHIPGLDYLDPGQIR